MINNMNNSPTFTGKCFKCNNFGHKSNMCRMMINFQNKRCYACGMFGHISNQSRMRPNQMSFSPMHRNVVCHTCNKLGHIARQCRRRNPPVNKNILDEKGKEKVDEIKDQHKKMWVKKEDQNVQNGSTLESGDGTSCGN